MAKIHPTAVVAPGAKLADDVLVGPLAVIDGDVELGPGVEVGPHAHLTGRTRIGSRSRIHSFAVVGADPQTQGFDGRAGDLIMGSDNIIREHCSIHAGTPEGRGRTEIGSHNLIQNDCHVAHDCLIGSHCVLGGYAGMGGHVEIEDYAVIGGMTGLHQFVRIGESAFTAGNAMVSLDVPPYARVAGDRARFVGLNRINLERRGFSPERIASVKRAFFLLYQSKLRFEEACRRIEVECEGSAEAEHLLEFLRASERGFVR